MPVKQSREQEIFVPAWVGPAEDPPLGGSPAALDGTSAKVFGKFSPERQPKGTGIEMGHQGTAKVSWKQISSYLTTAHKTAH